MNKYNNVKVNGFDSKKEHERWLVLEQMLKQGIIKDLDRQVKFIIIPKQDGERATSYVADFTYYKIDTNEYVVEDVKSAFTRKLPVYIMKRKLMLHVHGIKIMEV